MRSIRIWSRLSGLSENIHKSRVRFGISTPEQAKKMAGVADGVIVGSAIVKLLEKYGKTAPQYIGSYIKEMKDAVKNI